MVEKGCPVCLEPATNTTVFKQGNFDADKLDVFSFSSRKFPEYMSHRYLKCNRCQALYASPVPVFDELQEQYNEADFDSKKESEFAAQTYISILKRYKKRLPSLDCGLDIGASDGAFVEKLVGEGFTNVIGVEPSRKPVESAKSSIRPLLRHDIFRREHYRDDSMSLVTCFQTIEHVPDPIAIAKDVYKILKPGGVFYLVSHDYSSRVNRLLGEKSPIYDIEHLQIYCAEAFRCLLADVGFTTVETRPVWNTYPLSYWLRLAPLPQKLKQKLIAWVKDGPVDIPVPVCVGNMAVLAWK
ncbi:MAG: hypothetical protein A2520_09540 [Deltaproteobacteria bacterium RIFOXYD12_FULL_53_23]|nr:MAG: hypothetical protein A2520_09540 [Deltaproteobacteria bacterium RIFOXYD12_FULL_53_23]